MLPANYTVPAYTNSDNKCSDICISTNFKQQFSDRVLQFRKVIYLYANPDRNWRAVYSTGILPHLSIPFPSPTRKTMTIPIPVSKTHSPFPFSWESHGENRKWKFPLPLNSSSRRLSDCRKLYLINSYSQMPTIMTLSTAGGQPRTLIDSELRHPTGLTIDFNMGARLFWVDSYKNTIESCREDGKDRTVMFKDSTGSLPAVVDPGKV